MIFTDKDIERCIEFHGHSCPGLAIGMRAAEFCLSEFGHDNEMDMVTVCETDMCGVDAVQFLTGCTLGKGNLIHRDYGKTAFSFYSRKTGAGKRILLNSDGSRKIREFKAAMKESDSPERTDEVRKLFQQEIMKMELAELFKTMEPQEEMPRPAAILNSLNCDECGESVMESRARMFGGKTLCIPCFNKVEQKV